MFTGLIQHRGKFLKKTSSAITIEASPLTRKLKTGSSVAVDGVCLTVSGIKGSQFTFDVMPETLKKTNLGQRPSGAIVNLELPLPKTGCFEGHIVTGHVEGVGHVTQIQEEGNAYRVTLKIPKALMQYVVPKGSIALNGVSLTVINVKKECVIVGIIPYTWRHTNFRALRVGDTVNIETDILAKYLKRRLTGAT